MNIQGMNVSAVAVQLKPINNTVAKSATAEVKSEPAAEERSESAAFEASEGSKGNIVNSFA